MRAGMCTGRVASRRARVLLIVGALGVGCCACTSNNRTARPPAVASIEMQSQGSSGASVVVDRADFVHPGYLAVYANAGGAPGQRLGVSGLLDAGEHTHLSVNIQRPLAATSDVFVLMHVEDNRNRSFDYPKHDQPERNGAGVVLARATVRIGKAAK